MEKQVVNLTIFLIKEHITDLKDCLKAPDTLSSSNIKHEYGMEGTIFYCDSKRKPPRWKAYLETLSERSLDISDNASNKAILLVRIEHRIMAVVFGYGRSFLKEDCIERNFGFKVALNTINPNKMRSVNAATIEDMVVTTQRQASYSTTQDEFGLNITNDIMKGITGEPYDIRYGSHISGKDSLVVAVFMDLSELKDKLLLYYTAYSDNRYKRIGFEWVDNVAEIRDSLLSETLDFELVNAIQEKKTEHLHIAPPETTDWDKIIGFCYSGIGKKLSDAENYELNLNLFEYIEKINPTTNIYQKIRRDRLYAMNVEGTSFAICSIYSALVFQTEYEGQNYILCAGTWYQVETSFFNQVNNFIRTRVTISDIVLPNCPKDKHEGDYNEQVASADANLCLMDKKLVSVEGGPKQIEACDLFSKDKKFIHVKNKGQSAQLSHLFSQGKVSAECFAIDEKYRKQVSDLVIAKFGDTIFDYTAKPQSNEFEVVYAIIDEKESSLEDKLPFFSKVNLMLAVQELDRMHFSCSVCLVKKET